MKNNVPIPTFHGGVPFPGAAAAQSQAVQVAPATPMPAEATPQSGRMLSAREAYAMQNPQDSWLSAPAPVMVDPAENARRWKFMGSDPMTGEAMWQHSDTMEIRKNFEFPEPRAAKRADFGISEVGPEAPGTLQGAIGADQSDNPMVGNFYQTKSSHIQPKVFPEQAAPDYAHEALGVKAEEPKKHEAPPVKFSELKEQVPPSRPVPVKVVQAAPQKAQVSTAELLSELWNPPQRKFQIVKINQDSTRVAFITDFNGMPTEDVKRQASFKLQEVLPAEFRHPGDSLKSRPASHTFIPLPTDNPVPSFGAATVRHLHVFHI